MTDSCEKKEGFLVEWAFERYLTKERGGEREEKGEGNAAAGFGECRLYLHTPGVRVTSWFCFCRGVVSGVFGDIKAGQRGYLPAGGAWLRFDVVDRNYSITGYEGGGDSRAVFIGRGLPPGENWRGALPGREEFDGERLRKCGFPGSTDEAAAGRKIKCGKMRKW